MNEHLNDLELHRFVRHDLPADRALAVDDHLAECGDCRAKAATISRAASRLTEMSADLFGLDDHLAEEEIQRYVSGGLGSVERTRLQKHLSTCNVCASEIRELIKFRDRPAQYRPLHWYFAAAAAVVLLLLIPFAISRWTSHEQRTEALPGLDLLAPDQQTEVRSALAAGVAEPSPLLRDLPSQTVTLMGPKPSDSVLQLMEPLHTVTVSDQPTFRWTPVSGALEYTIAVTDTGSSPVTAPAIVTENRWTPPVPLPRDRTYVWQVTARRSTDQITAPVPPAPAAQFRVMDVQTAAMLERISKAAPNSHLLLGIVYTRAGARVEAEDHLRRVPPTDPQSDVARRTLERLQSGSR